MPNFNFLMPVKIFRNAGIFPNYKHQNRHKVNKMILSSENTKFSAYTNKKPEKLHGGRRRARSDRRGPRGARRGEAEKRADAKRPRPEPRGTRRGGTAGPRRGTGGRREDGRRGPDEAERRSDREARPPGERARERRVAPCPPGEGPPEAHQARKSAQLLAQHKYLILNMFHVEQPQILPRNTYGGVSSKNPRPRRSDPGDPEPLAVAEGVGPGTRSDEGRRQRSRGRGRAKAAEPHGAKRAPVGAQRREGKRRAGAAPRPRRSAGAARSGGAPGRRPEPAPRAQGPRGPQLHTKIIQSEAV